MVNIIQMLIERYVDEDRNMITTYSQIMSDV